MPLSVKQCIYAPSGRLSDGRGLYLLTKPSGSKSWVLRVQYAGHRRDFGLGSFARAPDLTGIAIEKRRSLTLADAREKARIGRQLAKAGISPTEHWRTPIEEPEMPTFETAAKDYHSDAKRSWRNGKHAHQWIGTLKAYAFPDIGNLPVDQIDASKIHAVLSPIWLEKPETARRVKQRICSVLDFCHAHGWRSEGAPIRALNQLLGSVKQRASRHFAAMPFSEVPAFMQGLREGPWSVGRKALEFLIITAARSGEVRGALWSEIDLEQREWRIPASRMKSGREHVVPLAPEAVAILDVLRASFGSAPDGLIFPGQGGRKMSENTLAKALRLSGGIGFTVHGFRSSFRDWAAESGFADAWAEAALAHRNSNKTEAAYRRTDFLDQRRSQLMPRWSNFLGSELSLSSVRRR